MVDKTDQSILPEIQWNLSFGTPLLKGHLYSGDTKFGGGGAGTDTTPHKVFLSFFLEDKTSVPVVFSSCSFISRTHFETSLVMVSCYGYKI